jgi:uncharacterized cupin superfamily protein
MPKVLLRSEQSGGAVSMIDVVAPAGFPGPPLHVHDFDEAFYVLEGELTFQLEDRLVTAGAGELAFAPRNVPHTFANRSGALPARLHAGELRAVLRAHGGRAGGRRAPGVGDAGLAGGHPRRAADRRVTV